MNGFNQKFDLHDFGMRGTTKVVHNTLYTWKTGRQRSCKQKRPRGLKKKFERTFSRLENIATKPYNRDNQAFAYKVSASEHSIMTMSADSDLGGTNWLRKMYGLVFDLRNITANVWISHKLKPGYRLLISVNCNGDCKLLVREVNGVLKPILSGKLVYNQTVELAEKWDYDGLISYKDLHELVANNFELFL